MYTEADNIVLRIVMVRKHVRLTLAKHEVDTHVDGRARQDDKLVIFLMRMDTRISIAYQLKPHRN